MRITPELTDRVILDILGERIERSRIEAALTQAELADRAGIGKRTLERIEAGHGAELVTLVRVMRALDLLDGFERFLPESPSSPIEQLELRGKRRQRVSHPRSRSMGRVSDTAAVSSKTWTWRIPPAAATPAAKRSRPPKTKV